MNLGLILRVSGLNQAIYIPHSKTPKTKNNIIHTAIAAIESMIYWTIRMPFHSETLTTNEAILFIHQTFKIEHLLLCLLLYYSMFSLENAQTITQPYLMINAQFQQQNNEIFTRVPTTSFMPWMEQNRTVIFTKYKMPMNNDCLLCFVLETLKISSVKMAHSIPDFYSLIFTENNLKICQSNRVQMLSHRIYQTIYCLLVMYDRKGICVLHQIFGITIMITDAKNCCKEAFVRLK